MNTTGARSRMMGAVAGTLALLAGACDPSDQQETAIEEVASELSAKVTVCKLEPNAIRFKMELACKSNETKCKEHKLAVEQRSIGDEWNDHRFSQVITRKGQKLIETEISGDGSTTSEARRYHAPITGVKVANAYDNGEVVFPEVDGREMEFAPRGTPWQQIAFVDGGPHPNFVVPSDLKPLLKKLLELAEKENEKCVKKLVGNAGAGAATAEFAAGNGGHRSVTVNNVECRSKQIGCEVAAQYCIYGAVKAAVVCGPFALLCGAGGVATCIFAGRACLSHQHRAGGPCCPVACGGENTPWGFSGRVYPGVPTGCCLAQEKCLTPGSWQCCSANEPPCGGKCCGSPNVCLNAGTQSAQCCEQQNACNGQCCSPGDVCTTLGGRTGCFRRCQVEDDCDIDDTCIGGFCRGG